MQEEVHRWRGSAEERAQRPTSRKSGQFAYFDAQLGHPDWRGKAVLDFGGNDGSLLQDPGCAIDPRDYTSVDVIREALEEGRARYPQARWVHYDRYNPSFNPGGIASLPIPKIGDGFGVILAYPVFTHTTREDMHELVGQLRSQLKPGGVLAFTFIDHRWESWPGTPAGSNLRWRLERFRDHDPALDVDALLARSEGAQWCALVDGRELYAESNGAWVEGAPACISYHVYYTAAFMRNEFPGAIVRPPVNGEMQHCCILGRES